MENHTPKNLQLGGRSGCLSRTPKPGEKSWGWGREVAVTMEAASPFTELLPVVCQMLCNYSVFEITAEGFSPLWQMGRISQRCCLMGPTLHSCQGVAPGITPSVFLQRHTNGQYAHENMLSSLGHQGNANQTTEDTSSHPRGWLPSVRPT